MCLKGPSRVANPKKHVCCSFHKQYPDKPLFSSEAVICFNERGVDQDFCNNSVDAAASSLPTPGCGESGFASEVANCTAGYVNASDSRDFNAGTYIWSGMDYNDGDETMNSGAGGTGMLADRVGFEKPIGSWLRSWWLSNITEADAGRPVLWPEAPAADATCFIVDHWVEPPPGQSSRRISVYTNGDLVALFVNGKRVAQTAVAFFGFAAFEGVAFQAGNLTAECLSSGARLAVHTLVTPSAAAEIRLSLDAPSPLTGTGSHLVADGEDVAMLRAEVVDSAGRLVSPQDPRASAIITFTVVSGAGVVIGTHSGSPASNLSDSTGPTFAASHGLVRAFVKSSEHRIGTAAERRLLSLVTVDAGKGESSRLVDPSQDDGDAALDAIVVTASAAGLATSKSLSIPLSTDPMHLPLRVAEELGRTGPRTAAKSDDADRTDPPQPEKLTSGRGATSCATALQVVCGDECRKADPKCAFTCAECSGTHLQELLAAGCDNSDVVNHCAGLEPPATKPETDENVHTVHLVFSHHLDVGLNLGVNVVEFCTGFATTVIQVYFDEFIPLIMRLAAEVNSELDAEINATAAVDGRFAYTIHPWIASLYVDCVPWKIQDGCKLENTGQLRCPSEAQVAAFDAAVRRGDILWADSPMNLNSGVVGEPSMFAGMLDIAAALNERYGIVKTERVWTNVDVPGFVRSSIPALKRGGATALNILANVGSHYPCTGNCSGAVPTEFAGNKTAAMWRWHEPNTDDEILVLFHRAQYDTPEDIPVIDVGTSYGGFTRLDNMIVAPAGGVALASAVLADNTGPPATAAEVQKIFGLVRAVFPNATRIFGSTWDKFVAEITPAEVASLPRFSSEWGDQWVAGMVNDPGRLAKYRALLRARADCMASGACSLRDPVMRNL